MARAVVADAAEALTALAEPLAGWQVSRHGPRVRPPNDPDGTPTSATASEPVGPADLRTGGWRGERQRNPVTTVTAAGGLPGELIGGWRAAVGGEPTMDVEYGFSCMGYELAGAWGAVIGRAGSAGVGVTTLLGDGSYLMLSTELFSAAFAGHGFVAVVCDNHGYAVIDRLQRGQGGVAFNNMYADGADHHADPPRVDFASHAAALGCAVLVADDLGQFRAAYAAARDHAREGRPAVVVINTTPSAWTDAGAWWEVGVPETAHRPEITTARAALDEAGVAR